MEHTIFYNGEPFTQDYQFELSEIIPSINIKKNITARKFTKKEGDFLLFLIDNRPTFICKKDPTHNHQKNESIDHYSFTKHFGEILEIINSDFFENIYVLFSAFYNADIALSFIKEDYNEKCTKNPPKEKIDISRLAYLGEESDGLKYLYDANGKVFIYAVDPPLNDTNLLAVSGQPEDTFFTNKKIKSIDDILSIIFNMNGLENDCNI